MSGRVVTITGGSGFVGQSVVRGLRELGFEPRVFDRLGAPAAALLRRRYLGTARSGPRLRAAQAIRRAQRRVEPALIYRGLLPPSWDDIQDVRSRLAQRFAGSEAVIHLAGIPHPFMPGMVESDFYRLNYDASINVFEAARAAGVPRFVFASSAQVYRIHDPVQVDQFPILETNYLPALADGQTLYGHLKAEFERYLADACPQGGDAGCRAAARVPRRARDHRQQLLRLQLAREPGGRLRLRARGPGLVRVRGLQPCRRRRRPGGRRRPGRDPRPFPGRPEPDPRQRLRAQYSRRLSACSATGHCPRRRGPTTTSR